MVDNTTVVSDFNESLRGLGSESNLPGDPSTLRSKLRTTSPSLKTITLALNPSLKKQLADAASVDVKDIDPELFQGTLRKLTALEIQTLREKFANPDVPLESLMRSQSRSSFRSVSAQELAAMAEAEAREALATLDEMKAMEAATAEEVTRQISTLETQRDQNAEAVRIHNLQAAEVAKRANEVPTESLLTRIGPKTKALVIEAVAATAAAVVAPVIGPAIVRSLSL